MAEDIFDKICRGEVKTVIVYPDHKNELLIGALGKKGVVSIKVGHPEPGQSGEPVYVMVHKKWTTDEVSFTVDLAKAYRLGYEIVVIHDTDNVRITPPPVLTIAQQLGALLVGSSRRSMLFS